MTDIFLSSHTKNVMNIVALYLPQYHRIKENDMWWGEGHTEWVTTRKGIEKYDGQYQPRIPLDNNYYNLLDINVMRWQTKIASEHGVNAFCVYHYWFDGKLLLEKPMENYLSSDIDFPFFFSWANETWKTTWSDTPKNRKILATNDYSNRNDWEKHFNYCARFFRDSRYIKHNNKPVFVIYDPAAIKYKYLSGMMQRWNMMAIEMGFSGMEFLYQHGYSLCFLDKRRKKLFDYAIEYYPGLVEWRSTNLVRILMEGFMRRALHKDANKEVKLEEYDEVWDKILKYKPAYKNIIPGAFNDWDNSARRKYGAKIILNSSPEKFYNYFSKQIKRAKDVYKKNMIVVFAWNEWSEGGYLEPDEKYKYGYLEAMRQALKDNGEFSTKFDIDKVFDE